MNWKTQVITCFILSISIIGCNKTENRLFSAELLQNYDNSIPLDTLETVYNWAMSEGEGLWEDSVSRRVLVNHPQAINLNALLQESSIVPGILEVSGGNILIADYHHHKIILADTTGSVQWITGETGEGPGHYSFGPFISINEDNICVWDTSLERLDLYNIEGILLDAIGEYVSYAIGIDDRLIRISTMDENGLVRILDKNSQVDTGFGIDDHLWSWENVPAYSYGVLSNDGKLFAAVAFSHTHIVISDLTRNSCEIYSGRKLPFELPEGGDIAEINGNVGHIKYFLYASMFVGPHGMINLQVTYPNRNGDFPITATKTDADYTLIDRYNWNGEYLDSYMLPIAGVAYVDYEDGYIYTIKYEEEKIYRMEVLHQAAELTLQHRPDSRQVGTCASVKAVPPDVCKSIKSALFQ
ncbi:hypothetical protein CSA37_07620 [Candidatus Fermentibacteria bacterium]|nr:MAG: hypothetical protein CSA37_07620 [Candidatus Fermentibacteria bacterium]